MTRTMIWTAVGVLSAAACAGIAMRHDEAGQQAATGGAGGVGGVGGVAPTATGLLFKTTTVAGREYKHVVFVPRGYSADKEWPCVVFLHGAGECGSDGLKQAAQGLGQAILWNEQAWPCVVLMPQKPEQGKQWEDYDAAVMAMLDQVRKEYRIDASRIALTGLSQGGHGSWTLGAAHADLWSAVAPICGYVARDHRAGGSDEAEAARIATALKGVPVWAFHGEADDVVKPEQTRVMVAAFKKLGVEVRSSFYAGVNHNSWDRAYREEKDAGGLAAWLLAQRRKTP